MTDIPFPRKTGLVMDAATTTIGPRLFGPFSLCVEPGERIAILGPSGAGKSSLLKLMSGERTLTTGQISLHDQPLTRWSLRDLSQHRAVLPQIGDVAFGLDTDLVIGLGRVTRAHDISLADIVAQAATLAQAEHLLKRRFDTLSGGERARVQLARIFAQLWDARDGLILVDEPLAALDPGLQFDILDSLECYASARHHAVVAVLHDINHAMLGFSRLLLIKDGGLMNDLDCNASALPALETLYGISLRCVSDDQGTLLVTPLRKKTSG